MIYSQDENPRALIKKANMLEQAHITTTIASELYLVQALESLVHKKLVVPNGLLMQTTCNLSFPNGEKLFAFSWVHNLWCLNLKWTPMS
jgi:hypothetical protein